MPMKTAVGVGLYDAGDDADDAAGHVDQRAAGAAGVHRGVELDHVRAGRCRSLRRRSCGPVALTTPAGEAAFEAKRRADGHDLIAGAHAAAKGRRRDALRQALDVEDGEVALRLFDVDGRPVQGAVGEANGDFGLAGDDVVGGEDVAELVDDDAGAETTRSCGRSRPGAPEDSDDGRLNEGVDLRLDAAGSG